MLQEQANNVKLKDIPWPKQQWDYQGEKVIVNSIYTNHTQQSELWISFRPASCIKPDNTKNQYVSLFNFINDAKQVKKRGRPKKDD